MTLDITKVQAAAAAAANTTDMTQAQAGGGGDYTPPAAGPARLRFIGYVELGKQEETFQGKPRVREKVRFFFELSGKNHPPVERDGAKYPHVISFVESKSLNEKANFFKLFQRMNYAGDAKHFAQLLGRSFLGEVVHRKYQAAGKEQVAAELKIKGEGYTIKPPRVLDPSTDEWVIVEAGPQITPFKLFLWDNPDTEQWASVFIDGEYAEQKDDAGKVTRPARSKNREQLTIRKATNYDGSPIAVLLANNGVAIDLPKPGTTDDDVPEDDDTPPAEAKGDALAGAATPAARGPAADLGV